MDHRARAAWAAARPGTGHAVDTACIAPWVSLEFDPQGWVYTCCANQLYPLGRIGDERLTDLWAGDRARVLREALARWDLSVGCGSCKWHLEHDRLDPDAAVYDRYALTSSDPVGPASMTFALSNRCNLGCVMCNGELSSTLRHAAGLAPIESRYDDQFFDDLTPFLAGLEYAKFLGGEPFLIREHDRVWTLMDQVRRPPRLQVTTNGTVWTDRVEWLIHRFAVDVTVSIDGATAATYERIRHGASHATVMRNVERFHTRCREVGTELRFCFCLMADNWSELADFLTWADSLDVPVSINVVTDPGLALHDLPLVELESIARQWHLDDAGARRPSGLNAGVWDTQRSQLDAVLAERSNSIDPPPRLAQHATPAVFGRPTPAATPVAPDVEVERRRLASWCGQGSVAEIHVDGSGTITALPVNHHRLGLDITLVGRRADELLGEVTRADGRTAWLLSADDESGTVVHTIALAADTPVRGAAGSVVRVVAVPHGDGWVMLVAEDRMHERTGPPAVAVAAPRRATTTTRGE